MLRRLPASLGLLAATLAWGSTFVVTKQSLSDMSTANFLAWRFGLAAALLLGARPRRILNLTGTDRRHGLLLGGFLACGFLLQTTALHDIDAGLSGFLTGTAVLLTPVVAWLAFAERIGRAGWAAVAICAGGLALLTTTGGSAAPVPVLLTLGGAACFAGHIASLSHWATPGNAYPLTAWSVAVAAILCGTVAVVGTGLSLPQTQAAWRSVGYLAVVATCAGLVVQAWAQSALTATTSAVIMTMEPVFAALLAAGIAGERLPAAGWTGGLLVVGSMFIAELGPRRCCDALSPRVECC